MSRRQKFNIPQSVHKKIERLSDEISHLEFLKQECATSDEYNTLREKLKKQKGLTNDMSYAATDKYIQNEIDKKKSKLSKVRGIPVNKSSSKKPCAKINTTEPLNAYELDRQKRIQNNHDILVEMGIEKPLIHKKKRPRKITNSTNVSNTNSMRRNLRSQPCKDEIFYDSYLFSNMLDTLKKRKKNSRTNENKSEITYNTTHDEMLSEELLSSLESKRSESKHADSKCFESKHADSKCFESKHADSKRSKSKCEDEACNGQELDNTKIEDVICFFNDETNVCEIKTNDLNQKILRYFPVIESLFAESGYKGVHKTKLGWLVQINENRYSFHKNHKMRFCGIYTELAMATFVFSMVSQNLVLGSSITFLYNTLNNLKLLCLGSDESFSY